MICEKTKLIQRLQLPDCLFQILTDIKMLVDCENGLRGRLTRVICHYTETNDHIYLYDYEKSKESTYFNIMILTINMDMLFRKNMLMMDINILKIYQCLQATLSQTITKTAMLVYTSNWCWLFRIVTSIIQRPAVFA